MSMAGYVTFWAKPSKDAELGILKLGRSGWLFKLVPPALAPRTEVLRGKLQPSVSEPAPDA